MVLIALKKLNDVEGALGYINHEKTLFYLNRVLDI